MLRSSNSISQGGALCDEEVNLVAAWAKRLLALLALVVCSGLGVNHAWADDADAAPSPFWGQAAQADEAAYTEESEPPAVGPSIVNRRAMMGSPARRQDPPQRRASSYVGANLSGPRTTPRPVVGNRTARMQAAPSAQTAESVEPGQEVVEDSQLVLDGHQLDTADPWNDHLIANGPDALVYSSGEWFQEGCWFTSADLVLMNRVNPKSRVMVVDTTSPEQDGLSPSPSMTTADGSFNIAPGGRITIGRYLGRDWANRDQNVEFSFLGLFDWDKAEGTESSFPQRLYTPFDPGFLFIPAFLPGGPFRNAIYGGFAAADVQEYEYQTTLNSFELNFRTRYRLGRDCMTAMPDGTWTRQLDPGPVPSLFAGLRYIRINETLNWTSQRFSNPALGAANLGNATGVYDIQTSNDLFGIQFGGDWTRQTKEYNVGGWIKLAGLVNFADQESLVVTNDNFFTNVNSFRQANGEVFTFAGEAGLNGAYFLNPNVSLRGGLQMMWIQSVAVATEQISFDFAAPPTVDFAGNIFYMGASVGLEVVW